MDWVVVRAFDMVNPGGYSPSCSDLVVNVDWMRNLVMDL